MAKTEIEKAITRLGKAAEKLGHGPGSEAHKLITSVGRTCRGPHVLPEIGAAISKALADGDRDEAIRLDRQRVKCGFDVNLLILSEAMDGEEHEAPCPGCGLTKGWRPEALDPAEA